MTELIEKYEEWNADQGLNLGSAGDHLFDEALTETQREWLSGFCERWEEAAECERQQYISRKESDDEHGS